MAHIRQNFPAISSLYFQRSNTWVFTLFFFVLGISAGAFSEQALPLEEKTQIAAYLAQNLFADTAADPAAIFLKSAGNNLGLLLCIFLSGLTVVGFPAAYAAITYKGAALGFSAALLLDSMAVKGLLALLLTVVPPSLLILPALFLAVAAAVNSARNSMHNRRKKSLSREAGPYCICFVPLVVCVVIAGLLEAFICPALLQLIR